MLSVSALHLKKKGSAKQSSGNKKLHLSLVSPVLLAARPHSIHLSLAFCVCVHAAAAADVYIIRCAYLCVSLCVFATSSQRTAYSRFATINAYIKPKET
jgi:hypothetical protein